MTKSNLHFANSAFMAKRRRIIAGDGSSVAASLTTANADDDLDGIATAARMRIRARLGSATPIPCPCCSNPVLMPTVELVIDVYHLTPLEGKILRAVWRGRGFPVMTDRIFDVMYEDDPNGGPAPSNMYLAFKVALSRLKVKLRGSGITVRNVGHRQGYRLVIGDDEPEATSTANAGAN